MLAAWEVGGQAGRGTPGALTSAVPPVYCCCCLANVSLPGIGGTVPESKPFFYVNVADIETLEVEVSYVACEYGARPSLAPPPPRGPWFPVGPPCGRSPPPEPQLPQAPRRRFSRRSGSSTTSTWTTRT